MIEVGTILRRLRGRGTMPSMVEGACHGRCVLGLTPSVRCADTSPVNGGG